MKFDQSAYGARIKKLRTTKGLTQEQLAEKMNISIAYISKIEKSQQIGSIELAVELSEFFGVTLDYLLLGQKPRTESKRQQLQNVIDFLSELKADL